MEHQRELQKAKEDLQKGADQLAKAQSQDLTWQKPEETDNLVKAEHPADDFMDSHQLDRETHGKKQP